MGLAGPASAQEVRLPELSLGTNSSRSQAVALRVSPCRSGPTSISLTQSLQSPVSIVGQFDFGRKAEHETQNGTELDLTSTFATYAFGMRWNAGTYAGVRPFVQLLGGAQRFYFSESLADVPDSERNSASGTDALLQVGGGIAVPLNAKWSLIGQTDYRRIFADEGVNNLRFVGGFRLAN